MENYNFLYTCDQKYFSHLLTSIYSLALSHLDESITVHIIEDGFSEQEYKELEKLTNICSGLNFRFYQVNQLKKIMDRFNLPDWRGSNMANARLFAREVLTNTEQVLYIDSDTVIVNPLTQVFKQHPQLPLSAVKEPVIPLHMQGDISSYYNSGVILFNYPEWDKRNCIAALYDMALNKKTQLSFPDQDIINLALSEEIGRLDIGYNITPVMYDIMRYPLLAKFKFKDSSSFYSYEEIKSALDTPHIFHLLSTFYGRPWDENNANPFASLYEDYRTFWDPNYENSKATTMYREKLLSFLNVVCMTCLPDNATLQIKNKLRSKLLKH